MAHLHVQDLPPLRDHSPAQERPLGGYGVLFLVYSAAVTAFGVLFKRSGRELPERPAPADVALVAVATHKTARLLAKSREASVFRAPFTRFQGDAGHSEVEEAARGHGLRLAIGELLVCPFCLGMWFATAFTAGMLVAPRATRQVAAVLTALFGSDVLQLVYKHVEDAA